MKNADKQLTEVEKLNDRLKKLFKLDESFVVTLNGEWGVGKTYFWNKFVKDNLSNKKTAYISLFGKENLKDIEKKIIFDISSRDKIISSVKDFKTNLGFKDDDAFFGIAGSLLNIGLSLFEKKDFKDVIVCFDDFERMSDKINLKDVLGLISELKEQKNCQVIMIFENNKIGDKELFSEYKEKIIDYELKYNPTIKEVIEKTQIQLKIFKDDEYLAEILLKMKINNIRLVKRIMRDLNSFSFIGKEIEKTTKTKKIFLDILVRFSIVYAKNIRFDLDEYKLKLNNNKKEMYEKMMEIINVLGNININDPLVTEINCYFNDIYIDKEKINKLIKMRINEEINENNEIESENLYKKIESEINEIIYNYNFKIGSDYSDFRNKADEILNKYNDKKYINLHLKLLSEIIDIGKDKEKYTKKSSKIIKESVDSNKKIIDIYKFRSFYKYDSELENYILKHNEELKNKENEIIINDEKIIEVMDKMIFKESSEKESRILLDITVDEYKHLIINSDKYYKKIFDLLNAFCFEGYEEYLKYSRNIRKAIEMLKSEDKYKDKIERTFSDIFETFDYYEKNNFNL
ncbi:KAP family NTPase [Aliarcobacter butzleri]|uniref:P-loop NTPase fold protein n=1 Tax=Aliarcobacter butzleri TaxID=28197 RepID=UPI001EDB6059|nr:P-loop NTPase fold protein [Aliarcobacter butzleri]MCG3663018.1 KAP family NTPase [Aliarcobacter butzleri]